VVAAVNELGRIRVGVDVGGTFTDAVLVDRAGRFHVAKVRTTPERLADAFMGTLEVFGEEAGLRKEDIDYLVHGTTVATNAVLQRRTARVGLVTTPGCRDVLEIGTQRRPSLYELSARKLPPLVPRELRLEVAERTGAQGEEVVPLAPADVQRAARVLKESGVEAVAVCFMFSFLDPAHERVAGDLLSAQLPGVPVTLSSDVAPEFREYLRTSTTVLNAGLLPLVGTYVDQLSRALTASGVRAPLHLMQSNGGVATADMGARLPIGLIASGPAAGVIGAARLGAAADERDLLSFDMGGTTADVALVVDGAPQLRWRGEVEGYPINLPQIDVMSVGSGGGSIARVDDFGSLLVGPESAGALPGPAAYGLGGEDATVTDAHLVLGTLDPARFLGGRMKLDTEAARDALDRRVARPLGVALEEAAAAVVRIAEARMAGALRVVSVGRGHDPRRFSIVAFGGAGPMHACRIADQLGVSRILVPRHPGVSSALGLLLSDMRYDLRRTWIRRLGELAADELSAALGELASDAARMLEQSGLPSGEGTIAFELDMRYMGQAYELTVPLAEPHHGALGDAVAEFHLQHERTYGHSSPVDEVEIVTLRAHVSVPTPPPVLEVTSRPSEEHAEARAVWMPEGVESYEVVDREMLTERPVRGPLIVEQADSTIVVPRGWRILQAPAGTALLQRAPP
jgi:N-methylhydantoinase A